MSRVTIEFETSDERTRRKTLDAVRLKAAHAKRKASVLGAPVCAHCGHTAAVFDVFEGWLCPRHITESPLAARK